MKPILYLMVLMITIYSALAFNIVENFGSLPLDPEYWEYINTSGDIEVSIDSGAILFNNTVEGSTGQYYYKLKQYFNMSEDFSVQFDLKVPGPCCGSGGHTVGVGIGQGEPGFVQADIGDYCGFGTYSVGTTPDDRYRKVWHNPSFDDITYPLNVVDSDWHTFKMEWDASTQNISYYFDGALDNNYYLSSHICENMTNVTVYFGLSDSNVAYNLTGWIDSLIIQATASEESSCPIDVCAINDTFDYEDSICNHGWIAGTCADLNTPINNRYVCNDSQQTIARYFPYVTADDGEISIQYTLTQDSDYDILINIGDQSQTPAILFKYDNGTITELKDGTTIGTYTVGTETDYKILINLQSQTYDFYIDGSAITTDIAFYNHVSHLVYLALQPDLVKGSPYCDYILDNVAVTKEIATLPSYEELGGNYSLGRCFNANPTNSSFNYDCCKAGEHPQFCILRVTFEEIMSTFSNYFFNNFVLFLLLVVIIIIYIFVQKGKDSR